MKLFVYLYLCFCCLMADIGYRLAKYRPAPDERRAVVAEAVWQAKQH